MKAVASRAKASVRYSFSLADSNAAEDRIILLIALVQKIRMRAAEKAKELLKAAAAWDGISAPCPRCHLPTMPVA